MGLFNRLFQNAKPVGQANDITADDASPAPPPAQIVPAPSSHIIEDVYWDDDNIEHCISFQVNDAFQEAESHAGEVMLLSTYAPGRDWGEEGTYPYMAVMTDDIIYTAINEYRETGTFSGALEGITPLEGDFYFKASVWHNEGTDRFIMYFYGLRWDYLGENGLCLVYPCAYKDTENEKKLIRILDDAAASFQIAKRE